MGETDIHLLAKFPLQRAFALFGAGLSVGKRANVATTYVGFEDKKNLSVRDVTWKSKPLSNLRFYILHK